MATICSDWESPGGVLWAFFAAVDSLRCLDDTLFSDPVEISLDDDSISVRSFAFGPPLRFRWDNIVDSLRLGLGRAKDELICLIAAICERPFIQPAAKFLLGTIA